MVRAVVDAEHNADGPQTHETEKDPTSDGDPLLGSLTTRPLGLGRHRRQPTGTGVSDGIAPPGVALTR